MTNIEYDLDLTGGLMDEIRRLVVPPQTDKDRSKRHRVQDRQQQRKLPGKTPNHDCCDSCKEGGDLLCCDWCSAAFHLQCHDPPLDEDDVPSGQWLCHKCIYRLSANNHDSQDEETASNCSSRSRQSEQAKYRPSVSSSAGVSASAASVGKPVSSTPAPRSLHAECDDNLTDLEFTADEIAAGSRNPLLLLSAAARQLNPRQFDLPKDVTCPVNFPGSSKFGKRKAGTGARTAKKSVIEMENGLVSLPAKLCFVCGRSCRAGLLLQCDYCPLLFHLDCLSPPLTALPSGRWMCPNHVEHALDERLLTSVRLSERILLWNKFSGSIDAHTVKVDFLKKVHRTNPPFRMKCRPTSRRLPLKVPDAVKAMYAASSERPISALSTCLSDVMYNNAAAHDTTCPTADIGTVPSIDANSVQHSQREWLQSVGRLHSDITKVLSSTATDAAVSLSLSAKPTASVVPQMQHNYAAPMSESATASEVTAAMETETDEVETVSVETSEANVSLETLSKESHDTSSSDVEQHGSSMVVEAELASPVCCESNCCGDVYNSVRRTGFSSSDNCCHSSTVATVRTDSSRCSDYEVASVLSDMQQLVAMTVSVTSSAPSSTASTSLNTTSDSRSTSLNTVDCGPVVSSASSCFTSMLGHASSDAGRRLRATLMPLKSGAKPIAMYQKCLTVGTGVDSDLCLSHVGHCQRTSAKHAVIFYDQWSHQFELLNYSEFGTMVDNVRYACDVSVVSRSSSSRRSSRQRPSSTNTGIDELRQLLASRGSSVLDKNREKAVTLSAVKPVNVDSRSAVSVCDCPTDAARCESTSAGWEGSACLHHDSIVCFGCLTFSFRIAEHETLQLLAE